MSFPDMLREKKNRSTDVEKRSEHSNSWHHLARHFLNQNDTFSAEVACKQGIRVGSRRALTLLCREIYWNRQRSAERIISCIGEGQLRWLHEDPLLMSLLGLAYLREGMIHKAVKVFHQIYCISNAEVRQLLLDDLKPLCGQSTPDGEAACRILSWFGLSCEDYKKAGNMEKPEQAESLDLSGQSVLSLATVLDNTGTEERSRIRFVDISSTQIRDITPLRELPNLEELHCYALTEPLGLLSLLPLSNLKRVADHRTLNEWERYRFKKERPDVAFI